MEAIEQAAQDFLPAPPRSGPSQQRGVGPGSDPVLGERGCDARTGNANIALPVPPELEQPPTPEIERQLIYTLNPLFGGRGTGVPGSGVRRGWAAKMLLPVAAASACGLSECPACADLMHVHGSESSTTIPIQTIHQLVDLRCAAAGNRRAPEPMLVSAAITTTGDSRPSVDGNQR